MVGLAALDAFSVQCDLSPEAGQQSDSRAREGQGPLPVSPAAQNTVGYEARAAEGGACDPTLVRTPMEYAAFQILEVIGNAG